MQRLFAGEGGPGALDDGAGEGRVDGDGVGAVHGPQLEGVEGEAVEALPEAGAAAGEQQVREVAVEEDGGGREARQQRDAGAELVDEEGVRGEVVQLARHQADLEDEVQLAQDGAQDGEAAEEGRRDERVAAHADIKRACWVGAAKEAGRSASRSVLYVCTQHTVADLVEAVAAIAVAREDDDAVAALLQTDGGVDDQPLGAAYAEVWVQKHDCPGPVLVARHLDGMRRQTWCSFNAACARQAARPGVPRPKMAKTRGPRD